MAMLPRSGSWASSASLPPPPPTYTQYPSSAPYTPGSLMPGPAAVPPAIAEPALQLQRDNEALRAELNAAKGDQEAMTAKLRDLDAIFKSRLTLLTDLYRLYKQFEAVDSASQAGQDTHGLLRAAVASHRTVIGKHYSDQELSHLGTSRYFFPPPPQQ